MATRTDCSSFVIILDCELESLRTVACQWIRRRFVTVARPGLPAASPGQAGSPDRVWCRDVQSQWLYKQSPLVKAGPARTGSAWREFFAHLEAILS